MLEDFIWKALFLYVKKSLNISRLNVLCVVIYDRTT